MIVEAEGIAMVVAGGADGTEIAHFFNAFIWSTKFFVFLVNFFSLSLFLLFLKYWYKKKRTPQRMRIFNKSVQPY